MTDLSTLKNPPPLEVAPLTALSQDTLKNILNAGEEMLECHRVLKKAGLNIVGELLKGQGKFVQFDHYPKGDVYDKETSSQYYYHAHRGMAGEHGHFHTFLRHGAFPDGVTPAPNRGDVDWPSGKDAVTHCCAISMDKYGSLIGLFATNRWVTDETWFNASDMLKMLDNYLIDHAYPSWATNRWLSSLFVVYRQEIEALLLHRDQVVAEWQRQFPDKEVYEDRQLEVTGEIRVSVKKRLNDIQKLLAS